MYKKFLIKIISVLLILNHLFVYAAEARSHSNQPTTNNLSPSSMFSSDVVLSPEASYSPNFSITKIKKVLVSVIMLFVLLVPITNSFAQTALPKPVVQEMTLEDIRSEIHANYVDDQNIDEKEYTTEAEFNRKFEQFQKEALSTYKEISAKYFIRQGRYDSFPYDKPFLPKEANERVKKMDSFLADVYNNLDLTKVKLDKYMTSKANLFLEDGADENLIKMLIVDLLVLKRLQLDIYNGFVEKNTSLLYTALDMHGNVYGDAFKGRAAKNRSFLTLSKASVSFEHFIFRISTMAHEGKHIFDLPTTYTSAFLYIHKGIGELFRELPMDETPAFEQADLLIASALNIISDSSFYVKERDSYDPARYTAFAEALFLLTVEGAALYFIFFLIRRQLAKTKENTVNRRQKQKLVRLIRSSPSQNTTRRMARRTNYLEKLTDKIKEVFLTPKYAMNKRQKQKTSSIKNISSMLGLFADFLSKSITKSINSLKSQKKNKVKNQIVLSFPINDAFPIHLKIFINRNIKTFESFLKSLDEKANSIVEYASKKATSDRLFRAKIETRYNGDNYYMILSETFISINALKRMYGKSLPSLNTMNELHRRYALAYGETHEEGRLSINFILEVLDPNFESTGDLKEKTFIKKLQIAA